MWSAEDLTPGLAQWMRMYVRGGSSRLRVQLRPPDLGQIDLRLTMRAGRIEATVQVERPIVGELIERAVPAIREALADEGVDISKFDVLAHDQHDGRPRGANVRTKPNRRGLPISEGEDSDPGPTTVSLEMAAVASDSLIDYFI